MAGWATPTWVARQPLRLALLFQMSYPGAPTVCYGDEVGLAGGDDPYNRATSPWADQGVQPGRALQAELNRLIGLRQAYPALRRGELMTPLWVAKHLIVLARRLGEGPTAAWSTNRHQQHQTARTVTLTLPMRLPAQRLRDGLTDLPAKAPTAGPTLHTKATHSR